MSKIFFGGIYYINFEKKERKNSQKRSHTPPSDRFFLLIQLNLALLHRLLNQFYLLNLFLQLSDEDLIVNKYFPELVVVIYRFVVFRAHYRVWVIFIFLYIYIYIQKERRQISIFLKILFLFPNISHNLLLFFLII